MTFSFERAQITRAFVLNARERWLLILSMVARIKFVVEAVTTNPPDGISSDNPQLIFPSFNYRLGSEVNLKYKERFEYFQKIKMKS